MIYCQLDYVHVYNFNRAKFINQINKIIPFLDSTWFQYYKDLCLLLKSSTTMTIMMGNGRPCTEYEPLCNKYHLCRSLKCLIPTDAYSIGSGLEWIQSYVIHFMTNQSAIEKRNQQIKAQLKSAINKKLNLIRKMDKLGAK